MSERVVATGITCCGSPENPKLGELWTCPSCGTTWVVRSKGESLDGPWIGWSQQRPEHGIMLAVGG